MPSKYLIAILLTTVSTSVAGVITVSSVTASSTFYSYNVDNLIDGAGLSGGLHDDNYPNMWMNNGGPTAMLLFNLGSMYSLDSASIWNYNADCCGLNRGTQSLNILVSTDDVNFVSVGSFSGIPEGTGAPIAADTLSLSGAIAQWVEFDITSNYGGAYTGLSAVQFSGDPAGAPEPSSGLLLLAAAAGGFLCRRRMSS